MNEQRIGCGLVFGTVFIVFLGYLLTWQERSHEELLKQFIEHEPDFLVIKVMEDNQEQYKRLEAAYRNGYEPEVLAIDGDRTLYAAKKEISVPGLPQARIIDKFPATPQNFPPEGWSPDGTGVIYRVFKQPKALDKLRAWLKEEGYSESDTPIRYESRFRTNNVYPQRSDSALDIQCYFTIEDKLYRWNGVQIFDLSRDMSPEGRQKTAVWRRQVDSLVKVGE